MRKLILTHIISIYLNKWNFLKVLIKTFHAHINNDSHSYKVHTRLLRATHSQSDKLTRQKWIQLKIKIRSSLCSLQVISRRMIRIRILTDVKCVMHYKVNIPFIYLFIYLFTYDIWYIFLSEINIYNYVIQFLCDVDYVIFKSERITIIKYCNS